MNNVNIHRNRHTAGDPLRGQLGHLGKDSINSLRGYRIKLLARSGHFKEPQKLGSFLKLFFIEHTDPCAH